MNKLNKKYALLKEKINELNDIIDDIIIDTDELYTISEENKKMSYNLDLNLITSFKRELNNAYQNFIRFMEYR